MADWASKRKRIWGISVFVLIVLGAGVPTYLSFYRAPTCFDKIKNGKETGVDCGGSCAEVCQANFSQVKYVWERLSQTGSSTYSVLAFVENPNINAEASLTPYKFQLYDRSGILVLERQGKTKIPRGKQFAVFESMIETGERTPVRVTFEFTQKPLWIASTNDLPYRVTNAVYDTELGFSRVQGTVRNNSRTAYTNLEAIVILSGIDGNTISFSRTVIDELPGEGSVPVAFTWQKKFPEDPTKIDIFVRQR